MTAVDYVGAVCAYARCDQPSEVATATVCTAGHLMHFGQCGKDAAMWHRHIADRSAYCIDCGQPVRMLESIRIGSPLVRDGIAYSVPTPGAGAA